METVVVKKVDVLPTNLLYDVSLNLLIYVIMYNSLVHIPNYVYSANH